MDKLVLWMRGQRVADARRQANRMRALLLRLRYMLWRKLAPPADTKYVTLHGYESMLRSRSERKRRARRFAKVGIGLENPDALASRLLGVLMSENVFARPGSNSHAIYKVADARLGFTGSMTESAIDRLVAAGAVEFVPCEVPPTVHIRETVEWWRVQPRDPERVAARLGVSPDINFELQH